MDTLRFSGRPTPPEPGTRARALSDATPRRLDPRSDGTPTSAASVTERISQTDMRARRAPPSPPIAPPTRDPRIERADALCEELTRCGPGDEAPYVARFRLLREVGLASLERAFPGLLWFDKKLPHQKPPPGRAVSPVASILVSLGLEAVPTIARLVHNEYAEIRYYAALVAIDLKAPGLVPVLTELALDEDAELRDVALEGLLAMRDTDACHLSCRGLERKLADPKWHAQKRTSAIRMLTALRWQGAVTPLISLLELLEPGTPELARTALRTLTTHDFALRTKDWRKWHEKNGRAPRTAWLLEGLVGSDGALRDFAAAELVRITKRDFGYRQGGDVKEGKRLQKAYKAIL